MSKFNEAVVVPSNQVVNRAGGIGYSEDAKAELVSLLLTSLVEDKFYESASDQIKRLFSLVNKVDPLFAAKAAVFARDVFGMRSITHLVGGALASAEFPQKRQFYRNIVVRPDDMLEILSVYFADNKTKPLPNAMKRGFADRMESMSGHALAKYKGTGKAINMYDVINLVHAKGQGVDDFKNDRTRVADTWETRVSTQGSTPEVWKSCVMEGIMGPMALLRNLRNIVQNCGTDPEVIQAVCDQLTDEDAILRSRLFPYRFLAAYQIFVPASSSYGWRSEYNMTVSAPQKLVSAINKAAEISLVNVPELDGSSAIIMDVSGSMETYMSKNSQMRMIDAGGMLGAMLVKKNPDSELVQYGDYGRVMNVNTDMPVLELAYKFAKNPGIGHGTNLSQGIHALQRKHERLIIVSDMQTWGDSYYGGAQKAWNAYNKRFNTQSYGYEINLGGYGHTALNNRSPREFHLSTITDKVFTIMGALEQGGDGLVKTIENTTL